MDLFSVNDHDVKCNKFDINQIRINSMVLDKADNWKELLFKKALIIIKHWLKLFQSNSTDIIQRIFNMVLTVF